MGCRAHVYYDKSHVKAVIKARRSTKRQNILWHGDISLRPVKTWCYIVSVPWKNLNFLLNKSHADTSVMLQSFMSCSVHVMILRIASLNKTALRFTVAAEFSWHFLYFFSLHSPWKVVKPCQKRLQCFSNVNLTIKSHGSCCAGRVRALKMELGKKFLLFWAPVTHFERAVASSFLWKLYIFCKFSLLMHSHLTNQNHQRCYIVIKTLNMADCFSFFSTWSHVHTVLLQSLSLQ